MPKELLNSFENIAINNRVPSTDQNICEALGSWSQRSCSRAHGALKPWGVFLGGQLPLFRGEVLHRFYMARKTSSIAEPVILQFVYIKQGVWPETCGIQHQDTSLCVCACVDPVTFQAAGKLLSSFPNSLKVPSGCDKLIEAYVLQKVYV